jgi:glycosyltransferase involved in cell wall biosynthesis
VNVALQVRSALTEIGLVANRRLTNVFEEKLSGRSILSAAAALVRGLLTGRPLPLQCALFATTNRATWVLGDVMKADVVYLDGIRTLLLLRQLRRAAPDVRIVVDLDDLMSRRYDLLARKELPLSLGYLERLLPRTILRLAGAGKIARFVLWYEHLALRHAEREVLGLADSVVLLNHVEATMLRTAGRQMRRAAEVVAIGPTAEARKRPPLAETPPRKNTSRAIFVGSDVLVQNRMTIAYLLDLWATFGIKTELFIYGRQKGDWPEVPNVRFCGYVADIQEAYVPGSIMVYPCLVPGGIKTKVLEAYAYGVPVIGNEATFEGILPPDYPLVVNDRDELAALLDDPDAKAQEFRKAVAVASDYLEKQHGAALFIERWRCVLAGAAQPGDPDRKQDA